MNTTKIRVILFCILIFFIFFPQKQANAATCPADTDTKIYVNPASNLCFSASDPLYNAGFNTQGGTPNAACQVLCPGSTDPTLPPGHDCIVETNGQCFAGSGPSGFNTPGCTAASTTPLPQCPPATMNLTTKVVDSQGNGIANVAVTITFADAPPAAGGGQTITSYTDTTGTAITAGMLHSGDHFIIAPTLPGYTFSPAQIGGNTNLGDQEMNTTFSCGTDIEGQQPQAPCMFTATAGPNAAPAIPNATPIDTTVSSEMQATEQAGGVILGIAFVAVFIQNLLGLGKSKMKREI